VKKREDPLCRIEQVLINAAETEEENLLAQAGIERLNKFRLDWAKILRREQLRAKYEDKKFRIEEMVGAARWNNMTPTHVDPRIYGPGYGIDDFPEVTVLQTLVIYDDKRQEIIIEPSKAFMQRVLVGMEVLKPDQNLDTLKLLPPGEEGYRGPIYRMGSGYQYAKRIPTNITGCDVRVDFIWSSIHVAMDLSTFAKVVSFPPNA